VSISVLPASSTVFTGLREEGGLALAEAMLIGTPVIVLAHGGARTIASSTTDPDRVVLVAPDDPRTTAIQIGRAMTRFSHALSQRHDPMLDGAAAAQVLRTAVEGVCDAAVSR
jgi:glycosyltransferase involved in cell wall biosynthesis